jgi:hypothetical protein
MNEVDSGRDFGPRLGYVAVTPGSPAAPGARPGGALRAGPSWATPEPAPREPRQHNHGALRGFLDGGQRPPPRRQAKKGLVPLLGYLSALTETTVAEVARTSSLGLTGNTALGVPAAAHTTS